MSTIPATEDNSIGVQAAIFRDRGGAVVQVPTDSLGIQCIGGILYQVNPDGSKIAINSGSGSGITALTGDVVAAGSGSVSAVIQPGAVTYAKIQTAGANSILGNPTGSTAALQEMSAGTVRTLLGLASIATSASASDLTSGTVAVARLPSLAAYGIDTTSPRIPFGNGTALVTDSTLNWDGTNHRIGLGTATLMTAPTAAQSPTITAAPRTSGASPTGFSAFFGTGTNSSDAQGFIVQHLTNAGTGGHTVTIGTVDSSAGAVHAALNIGIGTNGSNLNVGTRIALATTAAFGGFVGVLADKFTIRHSIPSAATTPDWHQWDFGATTPDGINQVVTSLAFDAVKWQSGTFTATASATNAAAAGFNYFSIYGPVFNAQTGITLALTDVATLSIATLPSVVSGGAPGTVTIANPIGLWVQGSTSTQSARLDGKLTVKGSTSTANVLPITDVTYTLGATGASWSTVWTHRLDGNLSSIDVGTAGVAVIQGGDGATTAGVAIIQGKDATGNAYYVGADGRNARVFIGLGSPAGDGNLLIGTDAGAASAVYGAQGAIVVGQVTTAPTSAPAKDHAVLWVDGGTGALKLRTNTGIMGFDGTGVQTAANMTLTAGATDFASSDQLGNVRIGKNATLATSATDGFPQMPNVAGRFTGTPTRPFMAGAPFGYDSSHGNLQIWDSGGSLWLGIPMFNQTATPGAGVIVSTNAPTGVVSLSLQYWKFTHPTTGVVTYIPFLQ